MSDVSDVQLLDDEAMAKLVNTPEPLVYGSEPYYGWRRGTCDRVVRLMTSLRPAMENEFAVATVQVQALGDAIEEVAARGGPAYRPEGREANDHYGVAKSILDELVADHGSLTERRQMIVAALTVCLAEVVAAG
jgi:hypothetical protein